MRLVTVIVFLVLFLFSALWSQTNNIIPHSDQHENNAFDEVQDKGTQVFNVQAYGATGDGSTDDRANIQTAYDAANSAGGGTVFFPHSSTSTTETVYLLKTSHPTATGVHLLMNGNGVELVCASRDVKIRGDVTTIDVIGLQAVTNGAIRNCTIDRPTETLASGINNSQTTITVTGLVTATLPATPFNLYLTESLTKEIMSVTATPSNTWTVVRSATPNAFTTAALLVVAASTADGIAFANGDSAQFVGESVVEEFHYNGVSALANRPVESKWTDSEFRFNVNNGVDFAMNNGERFVNSRFAKNGGHGLRMGGHATFACDGDVAVSNSLFWSNLGDGAHIEGGASNLCFNMVMRNIHADANGGIGVYYKNARSGSLSGITSFNGGAGAEFDTGAEGIHIPGLLSRRNSGDCVVIKDDATQISFGELNCSSNTLDGLEIRDNATHISVGVLISGDDSSATSQDSGIHIDGTSGTPDQITSGSSRFPGLTAANGIKITSTVGEVIHIGRNDVNYDFVSFNSAAVLIDADNDTTNAVFEVKINNQDSASATRLFDVSENGDIRVFNGGLAASRFIVRQGGTQGSTAMQVWQNNGGAVLMAINSDAEMELRCRPLSALTSGTQGRLVCCSDCLKGSDPCTASSTGAMAYVSAVGNLQCF